MDDRRTPAGTAGSGTLAPPRQPPVPRSPAPAPDPDVLLAADEAAEDDARRRSDRRFLAIVLLGLAALGGLSFIRRLSTLFILLPLVQAIAWPMLARRKGPREPGAISVKPTPMGRATLAVGWVLLLASLFSKNENVRLLVCALLACAAVAAPMARDALARVRLHRGLPARTRAGAATPVRYALENRSRRAAASVLVRDALGGLMRPVAVEVAFDVVPGDDEATAETTVAFLRRGRRRFRAAELVAHDPLGLFSASTTTAAPADTLVHPFEGRATRALLERMTGAAAATGRQAAPPPGLDHLYGVREFRDGDDPRRIHWRTTARRGVRTLVDWREERMRRVVVVLSRSDGRGPAHEQRFERAVSVAATALRACVAARLSARLVLDAEGARRDGGIVVRGPRGLVAALDALALVRSGGTRRPEAVWSRGGDAHVVVWVSAQAEPEAARLAGEAGGASLFLRADDPDLGRWVRDLP